METREKRLGARHVSREKKALGSGEDAARMRVQRGLSRLRAILQRKGVTTSAAVLAAFLTEKTIASAPAALAAKTLTTAVAATSVAAGIAKLNDSKTLMLAGILIAQESQGQFPRSIEALTAHAHGLDDSNHPFTGTNRFELVFQGSLDELSGEARAKTIVIRESKPWIGLNGRYARTYGFADGHSEIYAPLDGNFARWEADHSPDKGLK